ncbi:MAG: hypothetical protein RL669_1197, partial [Pseudomonadota bacterium]
MRRPAYVGLGANQGEARETLGAALESLRVLEKS